ncbi:tyrosine-type recombinase/integrase [Streptomyces europaeiscabiei]|uniref:tyrosine-type recombinase/integrase n=1 Tax=Streptomyces europaeiscabiei TaxID=146819 RepID=UPI0038F7B61D
MGKRQRDCVGCGAPVGFIDRQHCCRCTARMKDEAARAACPACGRSRVLQADTGRCITCSRTCEGCGRPVRSPTASHCGICRREADRQAAKRICPHCQRLGFLQTSTGWCGHCSRRRQTKQPPRQCVGCGQVRRHAGLGLCSACWQKHPDRPFIAAENLAAQLVEPVPWLGDFAGHLADRHCASRACTMISTLGRLLQDEHPNHPQALLERARRPGRSMGSLARALEGFFTQRGLALPTDQAQRLAAGRRQRRIDATPFPLRPPVEAFAESMLRARERAIKAGTLPRTDSTIDAALAIVRDLARFLTGTRNKQDWALTDVHDVEAFLATVPKARQRRLTVLRQYFRFARSRKVVLIDPTRGVKAKGPSGFSGTTVATDRQRQLFRRWTTGTDAHPHEALLGILALLHAASSSEVRLLRVDDLDPTNRTIRLGKRPHPVPMDPASWAALQRCLAHRADQRTENPHVIVTRITKAGRAPASTAYTSHLLDPCGIPPRTLRCTRLADLVNTLDPKLVAAAVGMDPEGVMIYLADRVDEQRLPQASNT